MTDSQMEENRRSGALYVETTGYGDEEALSWAGRGPAGFSLGVIQLDSGDSSSG